MLFAAAGVLSTQMLATDALQPQLVDDLLQKAQTLAQGIHQRHLQRRAVDFQRHAGKAGAGAHIDERFALHAVLVGQQAVDHMLDSNLLRLGNRSQVHHLICFHKQLIITRKLRQLLLRKAQLRLCASGC